MGDCRMVVVAAIEAQLSCFWEEYIYLGHK